MVFALYASVISILFMHIFEDNMWAFLFFSLLNCIFINIAYVRYANLINRIEKLECSQHEKNGGAE